jgi:hypothetical protein
MDWKDLPIQTRFLPLHWARLLNDSHQRGRQFAELRQMGDWRCEESLVFTMHLIEVYGGRSIDSWDKIFYLFVYNRR